MLTVADAADHHGGAKEAAMPCLRETARIVSRTNRTWSAAATGSSGAAETSNCPAAYSGCSWSTSTDSAVRSQQVVAVVGQLHQPSHPVRRTDARRTEVLALIEPSAHSISKPIRASRPASAARAAIRRAKRCWLGARRRPGCNGPPVPRPSRVGQPGRQRSSTGCSRRSPVGPPASRPEVMLSSTQNTSNTGDIPTPQPARARAR